MLPNITNGQEKVLNPATESTIEALKLVLYIYDFRLLDRTQLL